MNPPRWVVALVELFFPPRPGLPPRLSEDAEVLRAAEETRRAAVRTERLAREQEARTRYLEARLRLYERGAQRGAAEQAEEDE